MQLIQTATVGSGGASSISFSSIPQTFTDLLVVSSCRSSSMTYVTDMMLVDFNGAGTSNFNSINFGAANGSNFSFNDTNGYIGMCATTMQEANSFAVTSAYIPNYTVATNKSYSIDAVGPSVTALGTWASRFTGMRWSNTAAITSMVITPNSGTFLQFSTISLYGILRGSGGATVS
jgi:hypothetical protein